jgi:hypothetical protein
VLYIVLANFLQQRTFQPNMIAGAISSIPSEQYL